MPLAAAAYSLLAEVAEAIAEPHPVAARVDSPMAAGSIAQPLPRPARRRPRPAGRTALAAINQT